MASIADWRSETGLMYRALFGLALLVFGGSLLLGLWGSFRLWGTPPSPIYDPIVLGKQFYAAGDLVGAARELRTASLVYPLAVDATAELADVYQRMDDRDAIVRLHEARVAMRPFEVEPRFALGVALLNAGRTEEAISTLELVRQNAGGYPGTHEALARAYLQADRLADAEAVVGEGLRVDPLSPGLHQQLALTLQLRGNVEDAKREFERAARLASESAAEAADPSRAPL
jgi:Tfp pilus assembly protein PilF